MGGRWQTGDESAPTGTLVTVEGYHTSAYGVSGGALDNLVRTVAFYRTTDFIADSGYADPSYGMRCRRGEHGPTVGSFVAQADNWQRHLAVPFEAESSRCRR